MVHQITPYIYWLILGIVEGWLLLVFEGSLLWVLDVEIATNWLLHFRLVPALVEISNWAINFWVMRENLWFLIRILNILVWYLFPKVFRAGSIEVLQTFIRPFELISGTVNIADGKVILGPAFAASASLRRGIKEGLFLEETDETAIYITHWVLW